MAVSVEAELAALNGAPSVKSTAGGGGWNETAAESLTEHEAVDAAGGA